MLLNYNHFNVAAAEDGATFNYFIYCWVACEFSPGDQLSLILTCNNTS